MYPYPTPPRRAYPRSHPSLGAFLGLVFLGLVVPYALGYGLMAFGAALLIAGILAGAIARGGPRMGAGAGARAAGFFMLFLLLSYAVVLLANQGFLDLAASPEMARLVPYVNLMEGLWTRISILMRPVLGQLIALTGGDVFVELLLLVSLPAIGAALGGALAGAVAGHPAPRPMPMNMAPPYPPYPGPYVPPYAGPAMPPEEIPMAPGQGQGPLAPQQMPMAPEQGPMDPQEMDYLCPWCGLRVLPDMARCWSCNGPLDGPLAAPPPPGY
ncbi:MAG: hypothetical protein ACE5LS_02520 [Thermoplasmata archaeon]